MSRLRLEQTLLDDRYEVFHGLAQGSYAEIFVAKDRATGEHVIIKALNTVLQGSVEPELERTLIENFENEARVLDAVRHPNIVRRLGHGTALEQDGRVFHYLVLEYLAGGNLLEFCRAHGPLSLEQTLDFFQQVADGLHHAHQAKVIHRDLKPSNLILTADRHTIKIADFGVAKLNLHEDDDITRVGTNVYAPPEHHPELNGTITANRRLTAAADTYALAKTMYTVMSGQAPLGFSGKPITSLPGPLAHLPYADELLQFFRKATADEAPDRYPDVAALWADFSRFGDWQSDEETRVRIRPADSAPLKIPQAAPEVNFGVPSSRTRIEDPTPVKAILSSDPRPQTPDPRPPARIVIPLPEPAPRPAPPPVIPVTAPPVVHAATQSLFAPVEIAAPLAPPPAPKPEPVAVPVEPVNPATPVAAPPGWVQRVFTPSVIGFLITVGVALIFIGSMVGLYQGTKKYFMGGRSVGGATSVAPMFSAVTRTGVKVRNEPKIADDNVVGTLSGNVRVEVLEEQSGWYRIRANQWSDRKSPDVTEGWAKSSLFVKINP
ncbi:MAG: protein kinase [Blastocatellia bacterium]|nr:protein kinase [Blastocatellia bacterium]